MDAIVVKNEIVIVEFEIVKERLNHEQFFFLDFLLTF